MRGKYSTSDGYMRVVNNKLGYFGDENHKKKVIVINKKIHEKGKKKALFGIPKKDATLINTMVHEEMHKDHPKMYENTIRKETGKKLESMTQKQKSRLRSRYP